MKCQKCGKNEVNFHYSSNINGSVTETYLCSECAKHSGFELGEVFDDIFMPTGFSSLFAGLQGGFPLRAMLPGGRFIYTTADHVPGFGFNTMLPGFASQRVSPVVGECGCVNEQFQDGCDHGDGQCRAKGMVVPEQNEKIDDEMRRRRELNEMREQMRASADKDDFERAMELRDKIKEIEQREGAS